jgi:hypothetical protein
MLFSEVEDGAKTKHIADSTSCFDSANGKATVMISEGDGPFKIEWPNGVVQTSNEATSFTGVNFRRGEHDVLVTDVHDCAVIETVNIPYPKPLGMEVDNKSFPTCNAFCDGSISLKGIGGVGGYTYDWNNNISPVQNNLCAGSYSVVIKDKYDCTQLYNFLNLNL